MRMIGLVLASSLTLTPLTAEAQQPTIPRIAFLLMGSSQSGLTSAFDAFREGLRELGWSENENIASSTDGRAKRLADFPSLRRLGQAKVDAIIGNTPGALAAQRTTTSIPIIMCIADDAPETGTCHQSRSAGCEHHRNNGLCLRVGRKTARTLAGGDTQGLPRRPPVEPARVEPGLYEGHTDRSPLIRCDASIGGDPNGGRF
jgi:hypothetical protein